MINKCPYCGSENTKSIGGKDYDNISCNDCGKLSIVTWNNYKARADEKSELIDDIIAMWEPMVDRLIEAEESVTTLRAERDHWIDAYHAQEAGYNAAIAGAEKAYAERDKLSRQLAEAQKLLAAIESVHSTAGAA